MMVRDKAAFFDSISDTWDANEIKSTPEKIRKILKKISVKKGDKILDLGTGTGVLIPYFSKYVGDSGYVTGIDLSSGMLNQAIKKFGKLPNVRFIQSDFEENQIHGKYSLIMMYCVYPHIDDPVRLFHRLINENLEDGGRIIVAFPCDENFINNVHGEKKAEADMLPSAPVLSFGLKNAGFDVDVVDYSSEIYIVEIKGYGRANYERFMHGSLAYEANQEFPFSIGRSHF